MSLVHRVIVLNKPLKIRGFTVFQWVLIVLAVAGGFGVLSVIPKEWKIGNLGVNFIGGLSVFCVAFVFIGMSQMKPFMWWKNLFLYRLKLVPTQYLPHPEESIVYPDPTIVEAARKSDQFYVE
ncbi:MAG TPA: hypothetical protein V6D08_00190 [Candidatus Obscuribacterales bacterium]